MDVRQCCYRSTFAVLTLLVAFGVAGAGTSFYGVINPNGHSVLVDTALVLSVPPAADTFVTTGWASDSVTLDTFDFPDLVAWPLMVNLRARVDSIHATLTFPAPANGQWYNMTMPLPPPLPQVMFYGTTGVEESVNAVSSPRMSVSPSLVTAQLTVRLQGARPGRQAVDVWDAAGNLVRSLDCTVGANGLATATWNREDGLGRLVSGGVYFCRYDASGAVAVRKVLVAR
jgi:hypothetical protein